MNLKFLGHSAFLASIGKHKILFDPFISPNEKASIIDVDSIETDYILLTHGHGDHDGSDARSRRAGAAALPAPAERGRRAARVEPGAGSRNRRAQERDRGPSNGPELRGANRARRARDGPRRGAGLSVPAAMSGGWPDDPADFLLNEALQA